MNIGFENEFRGLVTRKTAAMKRQGKRILRQEITDFDAAARAFARRGMHTDANRSTEIADIARRILEAA